MSRFVTRWLLLPTLLLILASGVRAENTQVADLEGTPVVEWMELTYRLVKAEKVSAPAAARLYAYVSVAAYETLLPGMPQNRSLIGQLNELMDLPFPDESLDVNWPAAIAGSVSTTLPGLFDKPSKATLDAITALREKQLAALSGDNIDASVEYGESVGAGILDWAGSDKYADIRSQAAFVPPAGAPELWSNISPDIPITEPYWGSLRPFILEFPEVCATALNLPFSTEPASTMYLQAQEVVDTVANLTDAQKATADFWSDAPGKSGTPAGHWISIISQYARAEQLKLDRTIETYTMTSFVMADAYISAWSQKYNTLLLSPDAYIDAYVQPDWKPYLAPMPYPEYPSADAIVSMAAAITLTRLWGTDAFLDNTHALYDEPGEQRAYTSFYAAAYEAAWSQMLGGLQFRVAVENGIDQGRCVVDDAFAQVRLNPVRQGE